MVVATPAATWRYPLAHVTYDEREIRAVVRTLEGGRTTMGPQVQAFEEAFVRYVGARHAVMVNSGSSADLLCAFSLGPAIDGDEVLVPAVTWPTQVWACVLAGYRVRLVDVVPASLQMDVTDLVRKITPQTRAIFATHVLGNVGSLHTLRAIAIEHNLTLLEDCCEALGTRLASQHVGTFGKAGAFSFFFSHLLSTMEGGMVVTDDDGLARRCRLWRNHGWEPRGDQPFRFTTWGMNLRPTELQGAFGLVQLNRVPRAMTARTVNTIRLNLGIPQRYPDLFQQVVVLPECDPSWHGYPLVLTPQAPFTRDALCTYLNREGIETRPLIAGNLAWQPAFTHERRVEGGDLPGADYLHERACYLGLPSQDDPTGTGYVCEAIRQFVEVVRQ